MCTILSTEGDHQAMSPERGEPRGNGSAADLGDLCWRERGQSLRDCGARSYEGAASTDHDQQARAVSLFITDMLVASIGQGNGVTTVATPFQ